VIAQYDRGQHSYSDDAPGKAINEEDCYDAYPTTPLASNSVVNKLDLTSHILRRVDPQTGAQLSLGTSHPSI
jgi:hypothetical protein